MVRVLLFGAAADAAGNRELQLDTGGSVREVWEALCREHPSLTPMGGTLAFAVNEEYAGMDSNVGPEDEVAVLPPVSGG